MNHQWQSFLEHLWPSRSGPNDGQGFRITLLQAAIAIAIAIAAGPEVIAAMEMTMLLELLGASLFLTAFAAGAKLAAMTLCRAVYNIVIPAAQMSVLRSDAPAAQKALASVYVLGHAGWCLVFPLIVVMCGQYFADLVV